MKITLMCRPRTSSTALIHGLAEKYKITNLNEHYLDICINLPIHSDAYKNFMRIKKLPTPESQLQSNITNITKDLETQDNFIHKLFPRVFYTPWYTIKEFEQLPDIKNKILFNLTDSMNFEMYDKIYLLDRDLYTSCASWVYSTRINQFFVSRLANKPQDKIITLRTQEYNQLRFFILENILYKKIVDYLQSKNLPILDVTNCVSDYINEESSPVIKSNRKFPDIIENYDGMCKFIDECNQHYSHETKDWLFY